MNCGVILKLTSISSLSWSKGLWICVRPRNRLVNCSRSLFQVTTENFWDLSISDKCLSKQVLNLDNSKYTTSLKDARRAKDISLETSSKQSWHGRVYRVTVESLTKSLKSMTMPHKRRNHILLYPSSSIKTLWSNLSRRDRRLTRVPPRQCRHRGEACRLKQQDRTAPRAKHRTSQSPRQFKSTTSIYQLNER